MGDLESMTMSELLALDADAFCATLSQNWDTQQAASMYAKRFLAAMHKQKLLTDIFVDYDHDLELRRKRGGATPGGLIPASFPTSVLETVPWRSYGWLLGL